MRNPVPSRHLVELADGRRVNLLPSFADLEHALARPSGSGGERPDGDAEFARMMVGVPRSVIEQPWTANFDDYFRARAAAAEVPTALAGMVLAPVADRGYRVVDAIPAPIRRPFDRAVGILLDTAVSAAANAMTGILPDLNVDRPDHAFLRLSPYPQIYNSCGETMVATWLKGHGVPIALGEVDTQLAFFDGSNMLEDAELRKRGFTLISGPGTFDDLCTYLAMGYPVMVSVGFASGAGHYALVVGYDDRTGELLIDGWRGRGQLDRVDYAKFREAWARHRNLLAVAGPDRDTRLNDLRDAGRVSRTAEIQPGFSLADIWVTQRLDFFVEAAYRYKGTRDDFTARVNLATAEKGRGLVDMLGGSIRYSHRFGPDTELTVYVERLATHKTEDVEDLEDLLASVAVYVEVEHGAMAARAGYERGAAQAALTAELDKRLADLGAEARVAIAPDGNCSVWLSATGRF